MPAKAKLQPETDTPQQELTRLQDMIREAETEIERREQAEHEAYDRLLQAHQATLGGESTGDIVELRAAYQTAQGETQIMRDLAQRLRGDLVMAQNRADQAEQAAERADRVAQWNALAVQHVHHLQRFEGAVYELKQAMMAIRDVAAEQTKLDAAMRPDVFNRLNFAKFRESAIDAYLSVHLANLLPRLRTGSTTATDAIRAGKTLTAMSPFARKID